MNFERCLTCGKWHWTDSPCKPIFYFKHESWGDDFQEIRGIDFEDAAQEFAKLYNEDGDYSLMGSSEVVIISDGKTEKKFKVSAESDIRYYVQEENEK